MDEGGDEVKKEGRNKGRMEGCTGMHTGGRRRMNARRGARHFRAKKERRKIVGGGLFMIYCTIIALSFPFPVSPSFIPLLHSSHLVSLLACYTLLEHTPTHTHTSPRENSSLPWHTAAHTAPSRLTTKRYLSLTGCQCLLAWQRWLGWAPPFMLQSGTALPG